MDPTVAGPASQTMIFYYHSPDLGPEFLKRLFADSHPTVIREDVRVIDWVAVGKFAFGLFPRGAEVTKAEKSGLPIRQFSTGHFKEGAFVSSTGFTVSLFDRAPNPNAAKVFANWFLSREGQTLWLDYVARERLDYDSLREDVPKDKIPAIAKRVPGVKYFLITRYDLLTDKKPAAFLKQIVASAQKP